MNFSLNAQNGVKRWKRDDEGAKLARKTACEGLEYGIAIAEVVADVANDINSIPVIGDAAGIITGGVAAVSHITKGGMEMSKIALGCDDIPFDEIKEIMDDRFNELDRKLDQNTEALKMITNMVSKTLVIVEKVRLEMNKGFDRIIEVIENSAVRDKVVGIRILGRYFVSEKNKIKKLPKEEYVSNLDGSNFLSILRDSITPKEKTLYTYMHEIIESGFAIPENEEDTIKFHALYALFYGSQTFVSIFGFLLETHSYLAEYHYQNGDYEQFNKQVDNVINVFHDFKSYISGANGNKGILQTVSDIVDSVKSKNFNNDVYKEVAIRSEVLVTLKKRIKKMKLPILRAVPPSATIEFSTEPVYYTSLGRWVKGITVRYAVQFEEEGKYSKLSKWSDAYTIDDKACPLVSSETDKRNRLIFRKFNEETPQLVAVLKDKREFFRDIHRDLYNAIGDVDMEKGNEVAAEFLKINANVNEKFELGRTPLHNAAKSCNVAMVELLFLNGFQNINAADDKGYTALHVAVNSGCLAVITQLISKGANVNAVTTPEYFTPLHIAARKGYTEKVEELIKAEKIEINAKDKNEFTPIHFALGTNENILKLFLEHNADLKAKSNTGISIGHLAAMKEDVTALGNLSNYPDFDINAVDRNNLTPLHYAVMMGSVKIVQKMLTTFPSKIDINVKANGNNWTPLHYAIFLRKKDVAIELIQNGNIDVISKATDGVTPLHLAAGTGQRFISREIISKGPNLEDKATHGYTALHLAAIRDSRHIVSQLIKAKANEVAKTDNDETFLDLAEKYHSKRVIEYIRNRSYRSLDSINSHSNISGNAAHDLDLISSLKNKELSFGIVPKELNFDTMKLLDHNTRNSFGRLERSPIRAIDTNGTLLLMDLLLRKFRR